MQDTRPVLPRRRPPSGPPRTAVNREALRWMLVGLMRGTGWNQRQVADAAGVAKQRISDLFNHSDDPGYETALKLAALLDVPASEVMMAAPATERESAAA
jgi:DNA-binding XRE family transcriptional regulator